MPLQISLFHPGDFSEAFDNNYLDKGAVDCRFVGSHSADSHSADSHSAGSHSAGSHSAGIRSADFADCLCFCFDCQNCSCFSPFVF